MLEKSIQDAFFSQCQVLPGQTLVVGFSGGTDSLCLLHLLMPLPVKVIAAHFNHHLRAESDAEARVCRKIAAAWGCAFVEGNGEVRAYAVEHGLSIEEAARILRYRFLFTTAETTAAAAVAVAHHADDQVETVLMHLLRGAGSSGLAGMRYRTVDPLGNSQIPLIRPLLGVWRTEIRQYCIENQLTPLEDASNLDTGYFRNRIRLELVPELETYNTEFKKHLWQTAAILAEENVFLDEETAKALKKTVTKAGDQWRLLNSVELRAQPVWLQRKLIRAVLFDLKSTLRDIDYAQMERAVNFVQNPEFGKTCQITADLEIVKVDLEHILFAAKSMLLHDLWPQLEEMDQLIPLEVGVYPMDGGWELTLQNLDEIPAPVLTENRWAAVIDAEKVSEPLSMGRRKNGELFMPFGLDGKEFKLGDFLTNVHLPLRAREAWPLVRSGRRIVWIPGYRMAEFCKVTPVTRKFLKIELKQK